MKHSPVPVVKNFYVHIQKDSAFLAADHAVHGAMSKRALRALAAKLHTTVVESSDLPKCSQVWKVLRVSASRTQFLLRRVV